MKTVLQLLLWVCVWGCAYAWKFLGSEGAGNLLAAYLGFAGLVGALLLLMKPSPRLDPVSPPAARWINRSSVAALLVFLIWFGHPILASLLFLYVVGVFAHTKTVVQANAATQQKD